MFTNKTIIRYESVSSEKIIVKTVPFDTDTGIVYRAFFIEVENQDFQINYGWTEEGPEEMIDEPVIVFYHNDNRTISDGVACSYIMANLFSALSYIIGNDDNGEDKYISGLLEHIQGIMQLAIDFLKGTDCSIMLSDVKSEASGDTNILPYAILYKTKIMTNGESEQSLLFLPRDDDKTDKDKVYDGELVIKNHNLRIFYGALPSLKDTFNEFIVKVEFREQVYGLDEVLTVCQELATKVLTMIPSLAEYNHRFKITLLLDSVYNFLSRIQ